MNKNYRSAILLSRKRERWREGEREREGGGKREKLTDTQKR